MNKKDLYDCDKITRELIGESYAIEDAIARAINGDICNRSTRIDEAIVALLHVERSCRELRAKIGLTT